MKENKGNPLHLSSLNHISLVCKSVDESTHFYQNVLGFVPVRRPGSFTFDGAWLFGHGIGIHLLQSEDPKSMPKKTVINPKDNHISFQCENMGTVEKKLGEMEIEYVRQRVEEGGVNVDQLFFHDPDGFMVEICNCDNLPVIPLTGEMGLIKTGDYHEVKAVHVELAERMRKVRRVYFFYYDFHNTITEKHEFKYVAERIVAQYVFNEKGSHGGTEYGVLRNLVHLKHMPG
ncbi:metallothiol transferase [Olea europaea subsp. europaea]|uniref:Metallothiol transferase n=1 Tax=Olea europaea subsp. europaea TaxID=158383 RepID=A0A8S0VLQ0_OLEEU|nr:metallothiol transferase [Olea europaea subsp. europaea]